MTTKLTEPKKSNKRNNYGADANRRLNKTNQLTGDVLNKIRAGNLNPALFFVLRPRFTAGDEISHAYNICMSPDDMLCLALTEGDLRPVRFALMFNVDVNMLHPELHLPLIHIAAGRGFRDIARSIIATERCDLTVRDRLGRLPSDCAAQCARDYELAEELAEVQALQFRSSGKDPRRPTVPDYGRFLHEP